MLFVLLAHVADLTARTTAGTRRRLAQVRGRDTGDTGVDGGDLGEAADDPQAGLTTLEVVIIALGLFLLAAAAVAVITAAVNGRLSKIT